MTITQVGNAPAVDTDWQAVYVFYSAGPRPLLTECVQPLAHELRAEGLTEGYFYINYWLQGPHVRLRFKAPDPERAGEVRRRAQEHIDAFLARRPALFEVKGEYLAALYSQLFAREFSPEEKAKYVDGDGKMLFKPNNSASWEPYEPEYGKYGGPVGVRLAEWHFERSSDFVIDAMRDSNLHVRTVRLGFASQLMLVTALSFLRDPVKAHTFFERYRAFWYQSFADEGRDPESDYGAHYASIAPAVRARFAALIESWSRPEAGSAGFSPAWRAHAEELRGRVEELSDAKTLSFDAWTGDEAWVPASGEEAASALLLPFIHMTNNRMLVNIRDEAYLGYVLARALRELTGAPIGADR